MTWKPIDGRKLNLEQLQAHINSLPSTIWASGMTLHNTSAPSLKDRPNGLTTQHIANLEYYFKVERGWSSGPHVFVDDVAPFNMFTKFTDKGTHSPSWNGTKIGIEMLGDFELGRDDDDAGRGLKVKMNTVALFGMLHTKYGWDPQSIKMHYEDPATTHKCPGSDIEKKEFISLVEQWMGHAGEHPTGPLPIELPKPAISVRKGKTTSKDTLNLRSQSSASSVILKVLPPNTDVTIKSEAKNGTTLWFYVEAAGTLGWVAAKYVQEQK